MTYQRHLKRATTAALAITWLFVLGCNGRYEMIESDGAVYRLDKFTGKLAIVEGMRITALLDNK